MTRPIASWLGTLARHAAADMANVQRPGESKADAVARVLRDAAG